MKTMIHLLAAILILTATQCAGIPRGDINLTSKWDESFGKPIKSIYIEANLVGKKDEAMYEAVIKGLKKSLLQKGVAVKEDFTGFDPKAPDDSLDVPFRPDAFLVLGRPFRDMKEGVPVPVLGPRVGLIQTTNLKQRFNIQLIDAATESDIWVAQVSFIQSDAIFVGRKVVQQLAASGLVAPVKPD